MNPKGALCLSISSWPELKIMLKAIYNYNFEQKLVYQKSLINFSPIYAQLGLICLLPEFVIYEMWSFSFTMLLPQGIVKFKWP